MSGRQQIAPGLKRRIGRRWQHINISNNNLTSKEAGFGHSNIMQSSMKMAFPTYRSSTFHGFLNSHLSCLQAPTCSAIGGQPASQYRGLFGAIRLKLALAHDIPSPPRSVFQTLFLREMASGPLNTRKSHPGSSKGKRNYNCSPHMPTIVACNSERWRHFNEEPLLM